MSKKKSKKHPKQKVKVSLVKKPRTDPEVSPEKIIHKKPVWRLGRLDFHGEWGFSKIKDLATFQTIKEKLKNFETMTWGEIEKNRHNHYMETNKICNDAQKRLGEIGLLEYDTLYSLRLLGANRLWGIRDNEILYILWWDPKHTVFPIKKTHT